MARIADFTIITDSWVSEFGDEQVEFEVPDTLHTGSRSVLGFMLEFLNIEDASIVLRLNGEKIWNWNYSDGRRVQYFQEVIASGVLKAGNNVLRFDSSSDDARSLRISDAVIWWQASI
ncbi:hypothetical protein [Arenimonas sp.]|uniref:hypothetical protein n=1 Tax=Arenimonas sp. TaxID=1872635 RepID=UPI0039E5F735